MPNLARIITETERLVLREWTDLDLDAFARLNTDETVMRYFPHPLTRAQSDALAWRIRMNMIRDGFGVWAVEIREVTPFAGFTGISRTSFDENLIEIAWRFDCNYWHQGYATEAARAALDWAFKETNLESIVAFTAEINVPSWRLMQRLGMRYEKNFAHPELAADDRLSNHRLYRITRNEWLKI